MRFLLVVIISLFVLVFGVICSIYVKNNLFKSSTNSSNVTFLIKKNEKLSSISRRLAEKDLIISKELFEYGARYRRLDKTIKYGEFILTTQMSIVDILKKFTTNQALSYKVIIRDCMTNWEILELFKQKYFLINDLMYFELDEGTFAPNTYNVSYNTKFSELFQLMRSHQSKILRKEWIKRQKESPIKDQRELLILASIIEKEAASFTEMPIIASVFINRLNIGMRLQSDPTVNYGLDHGNIDKRKTLTRKDLKVLSAHNTYRIPRLPASPICNPSESAINAAANPAYTKYFYFVLNETGTHSFSETFEEHKKKVSLWRNFKNN